LLNYEAEGNVIMTNNVSSKTRTSQSNNAVGISRKSVASVALLAAAVLFGSSSFAGATEQQSKTATLVAYTGQMNGSDSAARIVRATPARKNVIVADTSVKPWTAPVGHRQPRRSEAYSIERSNSDDQRWLDKQLDQRLVICNGC
jgi:hypothetical protein